MFTMDRYVSEYIASKTKLTPPSVSFKPSPEFSKEVAYRSSLFDISNGGQVTMHKPNAPVGQTSRKPTKKADALYIIDDSTSMEDVISELGSED